LSTLELSEKALSKERRAASMACSLKSTANDTNEFEIYLLFIYLGYIELLVFLIIIFSLNSDFAFKQFELTTLRSEFQENIRTIRTKSE